MWTSAATVSRRLVGVETVNWDAFMGNEDVGIGPIGVTVVVRDAIRLEELSSHQQDVIGQVLEDRGHG